jgi:L-amino acid N-acyltransferase YncA
MKNLTFQEADEKDLDIILETYNFYIDTTTATFDHNQISKDELLQRIFIGHEKCAHYKEVGEKFNRLVDIIDYQKILHDK